MYYKIISNGAIVDASSVVSYVRWQEKNQMWLACDAEDAQGIINSNGKDIYLLPGAEAMDGYAYATIAEITEEEHTELREELDAEGEVEEQDNRGETAQEQRGKTRIQLLEEQIAELQGQVRELMNSNGRQEPDNE